MKRNCPVSDKWFVMESTRSVISISCFGDNFQQGRIITNVRSVVILSLT